ncbi:hypothetical protein D8Y22_21090 [Salinadaptatus halalkaliphilus]|uniref:Uncharacterized protein n=1 Tax=Salinadaptatus halalkaliphilus TaxID=2419781 RepID=A0A4S3TK45_9EURY|nr:hypothetical protein D8Y22_21090 [Salinadaptatus halalkaliphilus]
MGHSAWESPRITADFAEFWPGDPFRSVKTPVLEAVRGICRRVDFRVVVTMLEFPTGTAALARLYSSIKLE